MDSPMDHALFSRGINIDLFHGRFKTSQFFSCHRLWESLLVLATPRWRYSPQPCNSHLLRSAFQGPPKMDRWTTMAHRILMGRVRIFTYMKKPYKIQRNVGKYTSPMDLMVVFSMRKWHLGCFKDFCWCSSYVWQFFVSRVC